MPDAVTSLGGAPEAAPDRRKAEKTAREFEAVFVGQIAKLMMESAGAPSEFGGGHGEEMFRGVLAEQLGTEIAKRGGLGLAPAVLDQIIRLQQGDRP